MKAALIRSYGGPHLVTPGSIDEPALRPDEAWVRVEAASVNPLDLKIIIGSMQQVFPTELPYVPGTDFSGVVERVGPKVTRVRPGDRVVGRVSPNRGGAFAQQVAIRGEDLCLLPVGMSCEQAAALPTAFGTAMQALFEVGGLRAGHRVLIHGGAGGVGTFAVQLARHAGAHVTATASAGNQTYLRSLGAHETIDYRAQGFAHLRDVDLVLDTIGGDTLEQSWVVLGPEGRIATLVDFAIRHRGNQAGEFVFFSSPLAALPRAMEMFAAGQLQIVIDAVFALSETRQALEKVATGHTRGKVLLRTDH